MSLRTQRHRQRSHNVQVARLASKEARQQLQQDRQAERLQAKLAKRQQQQEAYEREQLRMYLEDQQNAPGGPTGQGSGALQEAEQRQLQTGQPQTEGGMPPDQHDSCGQQCLQQCLEQDCALLRTPA